MERIQDSQRLYAVRDFIGALKSDGIQIIAEIKRRSPADGDINIQADPGKIAKTYANNGAACISVLTDQHYFGGQLEFIQQVKAVVELPVLRKDFIISEYQVWETFQGGADAILLIADAIEASLLKDLYDLAQELGLHVLIETHNADHLKWISDLNPEIVGVNCRNLSKMETDIMWFESIAGDLPQNSIYVAESGIKSHLDLNYISKLGFHSVLVGSSLMKSQDPGMALAELTQRVPV
ncbi:uncharacterized protein METZ01_LOCUS289631 [marine metagenome]|uniref:indole-3-glycerol-phosphate synthase n=1 Tax=marine metagenome TaxID=408172 RepID=A0A382LNF9_9ZZZZ